jgi:hypothetical protein
MEVVEKVTCWWQGTMYELPIGRRMWLDTQWIFQNSLHTFPIYLDLFRIGGV